MSQLITVDEAKQNMIHITKAVRTLVKNMLPSSNQHDKLNELINDMQADFHTVVVLGEFKRGKSTFMNALLGDAILPVDVTPTTATINAIMWGEEPKLEVYHANGTSSELELTNENLANYVASRDFDPSTVNYLKISLPDERLKNNVVFIDTPGVGDLNSQRVEVTYNFIPRADTVLFLLDATSPVKRTEYEFLTETLLKQGLDRILFLVNFMDELDEDEEEEILELVKRRLTPAVGDVTDKVLPLSADLALQGKIENDQALIDESGLPEVEKAMNALIQHGSMAEEKIKRFQSRLKQIIDSTIREVAYSINMIKYSEDEIEQQLEQIQKKLHHFDDTKESLLTYVEDRETEIKAMVAKSLKHFGDSLTEDLMLSLDQYQSPNIKEYVETQLPQMIQKRMKQWTEQYIGSINKLLQMLDKEIAIGLANEFNATIEKLDQSNRQGLLTTDQVAKLSISADDISNTPIIAGLLAGGAGTVAMLLGGPLLLPILGMAGYPFLQKHLMEQKLQQAKDKLKPELEARMQEVLNQFYYEMKEYVVSNTTAIRESALQRYQELVQSMEAALTEQLEENQSSHKQTGEKRTKLEQARKQLQAYAAKLEDVEK